MRELAALLGLTALALAVSAIGPVDRLTWWLEVSPVLLGAPLLVWSRASFPLTPVSGLAHRKCPSHDSIAVGVTEVVRRELESLPAGPFDQCVAELVVLNGVPQKRCNGIPGHVPSL